MTRSKRMQTINKVAQKKEQDAARILGQSRQNLQLQNQRLSELMQYREDYTRKFSASGNDGMDTRKLNEYRSFLHRLNQAILQQREIITRADRECQLRERAWLGTRTRTQALDKVVERYQHEEQREVDRKEQKVQDEHALRLESRFKQET